MSDEESLDEFLKRGGKITKCKTIEKNLSIDERHRLSNLQEHRFSMAERVENYKKKSGGKLPKHTKMYLKFRKRFGV